MKRKFLFCLFLVCSVSLLSLKTANRIQSLEDAIKTGAISCTYKANPESPHYVKPLLLTVKNKKNIATAIKIEPGQQFFPIEENYQNLVVTRENTILLNPFEQKTVEVFAMCTENGDAAPGKTTIYKLAPPASGNLAKTAEFISKQKSNNITGQYAIWAVSDNRELEEIYGPDTSEARNLQRFLAKITGKKIPPPPAADNYANNYYAAPRTEVSYTGNFGMSIYKPAALNIALFNSNNVVVREMYNNPAVPKGDHTFTYAFDNTVYTDDFYWVRIMVDGDIKFQRKIKMNMD